MKVEPWPQVKASASGAPAVQIKALRQVRLAEPFEQLRDSALKLLSSFKVPTVWLLLDTDDPVPRGTTGKVDVRRLRDMLR